MNSYKTVCVCELYAVADKIKKDLVNPSAVTPDLSKDEWLVSIYHKL